MVAGCFRFRRLSCCVNNQGDWLGSVLTKQVFIWGFDGTLSLCIPPKRLMPLTISAGKSVQHVLEHPRNIVVVVIVR